jgi:hypothetical protein
MINKGSPVKLIFIFYLTKRFKEKAKRLLEEEENM